MDGGKLNINRDSLKLWANEKVDLGIALMPNWLFWPIFMAMFIAIIVLVIMSKSDCKCSSFENLDLYGNSIRFLQRRDDTGSIPTSLDERTSN